MSTFYAAVDAIIDLACLELVGAIHCDSLLRWPPRPYELQQDMEAFTPIVSEADVKAYHLLLRYATDTCVEKQAPKSAIEKEVWIQYLQGLVAYHLENNKQFIAAYHGLSTNQDVRQVFRLTTATFESLSHLWDSVWEDVEQGYIYIL